MGTQDAAANIGEKFVFQDGFLLADALARLETKCDALPADLKLVATTFVESIKSTETVSAIPYNLAWLGAADVVLNSISHHSTILALDQLDPFKDDLDAEVPKLSDELARQEFVRFLESTGGREQLRERAEGFLRRGLALNTPQLASAAQHLHLQCAVSIWAAMEAFISDFVRGVINLEPRLVSKLLADDECKKRIGRTKWTLDQLLELGLDLSSKVGDLVLSENDLSDLVSMKAVLFPLFDRPSDLVSALDAEAVYVLGKSRHLLVHRAGRVDGKFERETAGRWKAGTQLTITTRDLQGYAKAASNVVQCTIDAYLTTVR